ncbi:gamma-glutamyltransferase [Luedemannella flava]
MVRTIPVRTIAAAVLTMALAGADPAAAASPPTGPTAVGYGGAVATVDAEATRVGLQVLRDGGNAVDAAIAAAATLGVTEPFSAGIGGGGFLVYYDARTGRVHTIDGRESAPASMTATSFINLATGAPYAFGEARVAACRSACPARRPPGSGRCATSAPCPAGALRPAARVAERGFAVDATFRAQIADNAAAFGQFSSTSALFLPDGAPPAVGSTFRNPDLARTYDLIGRHGTGAFYRGRSPATSSPP